LCSEPHNWYVRISPQANAPHGKEAIMSAPSQRNRKNPIGFTPRPEHREAAEIARSRLESNPYLALKTVSCDFREGKLTLRGSLPSYFLKQMAQAVIGTVEGVEQIVNQIEVVPPDKRR
jgi:osmotically-inducible protein OsmY